MWLNLRLFTSQHVWIDRNRLMDQNSPVAAEESFSFALGVRRPDPRSTKRTQLVHSLGCGRLEGILGLKPTVHDAAHILGREQVLSALGRLCRGGQGCLKVLINGVVDVRRRPEAVEEEVHSGQERLFWVMLLDVDQGTQRRYGQGHGHEVLGEAHAALAYALGRAPGVSRKILVLGGEHPWRLVSWRYSQLLRLWIDQGV